MEVCATSSTLHRQRFILLTRSPQGPLHHLQNFFLELRQQNSKTARGDLMKQPSSNLVRTNPHTSVHSSQTRPASKLRPVLPTPPSTSATNNQHERELSLTSHALHEDSFFSPPTAKIKFQRVLESVIRAHKRLGAVCSAE